MNKTPIQIAEKYEPRLNLANTKGGSLQRQAIIQAAIEESTKELQCQLENAKLAIKCHKTIKVLEAREQDKENIRQLHEKHQALVSENAVLKRTSHAAQVGEQWTINDCTDGGLWLEFGFKRTWFSESSRESVERVVAIHNHQPRAAQAGIEKATELSKGWLEQAAKDAAEIVRLETLIESIEANNVGCPSKWPKGLTPVWRDGCYRWTFEPKYIKAPTKEFIEAQPERKPDSDSVRRLKMSDITGRKRGRSVGKDQQSAVVGQAEAPAATPSGGGEKWTESDVDPDRIECNGKTVGYASNPTQRKNIIAAHNAALQ